MSVSLRQGLRALVQTTLASPPSGSRLLYPKSDGWYDRDSAGLERKLEFDIVGTGSGASQTIAGNSDTYIAGSAPTMVPAGSRLQVGTWYYCKFRIVKTAAGVAAPALVLRVGTAGSTADTARCTFTFAAQTAVIDEGEIEVMANFSAVGAAAVLQGNAKLSHRLVTTGLNVTAVQTFIAVTSASFDSSTATRMGLSLNVGASGSWTVNPVQSEIRALV